MTYIKPDYNLVLALAGTLQSSMLVYQLAHSNRYDVDALHDSAYSLLRLDATTTEEVFGSLRGINLGLRTTIRLFANKPDHMARDLFRYALEMHQLSIKLAHSRDVNEQVKTDLVEIRTSSLKHYGDQDEDDTLYEKLGLLYTNSISHLTPRIMVRGNQEKLQDFQTVNRVRTALFAGIRSAFLWHQFGGRRWQFLLHRKGYRVIASQLLQI